MQKTMSFSAMARMIGGLAGRAGADGAAGAEDIHADFAAGLLRLE